MRLGSEILIILILTHLLRTKILIHLKIYSVYLTQILLYNCGYSFFTSIFNKHAPYCTKRVKTRQHNHWFTSEIKLLLRHRDWLLKHGSHGEYKKQRNNVKTLIRKAKKTYFEKIIKNKGSQKSIWTAINEITGKKKHVQTNPSISLKANDFSSSLACTNSFSNIMYNDDLFKASHLTRAFCQEKHLRGHG